MDFTQSTLTMVGQSSVSIQSRTGRYNDKTA